MKFVAGLVLMLVTAACTPTRAPESNASLTAPPAPEPIGQLSATMLPVSGDRSYVGSIDIRAPHSRIDIGSQPARLLLSLDDDGAILMGVVTADGDAFRYRIVGDSNERIGTARFELTEPRPPALFEDGIGSLSLPSADSIPLPDALAVTSSDNHTAVLVEPTDHYDHGVLGDSLEAASVEIRSPGGATTTIEIADDGVVEGLAPMWVDIDGDGTDELIVTVSRTGSGAGVVALDPSGGVVAEGPPIGRSFRWRHVIGSMVGPSGEIEVVVVRTPHIGGIAEWYRFIDGRLQIVATADGITSHRLGSRNLELALIADVDGDGKPELLAPSQDLTQLVALGRDADGATERTRFDLPATLTTNIAALSTPAGLVLAAGIADGTILLWSP